MVSMNIWGIRSLIYVGYLLRKQEEQGEEDSLLSPADFYYTFFSFLFFTFSLVVFIKWSGEGLVEIEFPVYFFIPLNYVHSRIPLSIFVFHVSFWLIGCLFYIPCWYDYPYRFQQPDWFPHLPSLFIPFVLSLILLLFFYSDVLPIDNGRFLGYSFLLYILFLIFNLFLAHVSFSSLCILLGFAFASDGSIV